MASGNNEGNDEGDLNILIVEDKFRKMIISEEWVAVDKTKPLKDKESYKPVDPSELRPYVHFTVEELSFTTRLDTWSNCNVRVPGIFRIFNEKYYLESIDEPGGPYRILIICAVVAKLPESDESVQVFGKIKLNSEDNKTQSFIDVLFFNKIVQNHLYIYREAIVYLRPYIPLFINTGNSVSENDEDYYDCHRQFENNYKSNDASNLRQYSDDDFNFACNTDCLF